MDMEGALRARLLAAAPVAALVGTRVSWVERPQLSALPAITLQVISDDRPQDYDGFAGLRSARVQMDAWGATYASVKSLAEAAIQAVIPAATSNGIVFARAFVDGERDLGEQTSTVFVHRRTVDLIVWHQPQ